MIAEHEAAKQCNTSTKTKIDKSADHVVKVGFFFQFKKIIKKPTCLIFTWRSVLRQNGVFH